MFLDFNKATVIGLAMFAGSCFLLFLLSQTFEKHHRTITTFMLPNIQADKHKLSLKFLLKGINCPKDVQLSNEIVAL